MIDTKVPSDLERRREDYKLITGGGGYVDDLRSPEGRPPALYMVVVRSPYAHARITGIHMDAARDVPGIVASEAVREKTLKVAAQVLEAAIEDLELESGQVRVKGVPNRLIELGELARLVEEQPELIEREKPNPSNGAPIEGLAAWRDFTPSSATFSSGTHMAVVEVDSDTGEVHILQYVAVDDCGRVLNHYLADAQVHGALAQGIGQALYEEVMYDEDGQLLSSTLMDYTMPNAVQVPNFITDVVETPSPINPLGAKGIGEGGTIGAPPTIVNAVLDALAPLGIEAIDMPLRPEKIWTFMHKAHQGKLEKVEVNPPRFFEKDEGMQEGGVPDFV